MCAESPPVGLTGNRDEQIDREKKAGRKQPGMQEARSPSYHWSGNEVRIFIIEMRLRLHMKKICCFALMFLVLLATGMAAAEVPDLLGKWTGSWTSYDEGKGLHEMTENESMILAFTEQEGRIFAGNLTIMLEDETEIDEGFAGAVGLDNKTLYIVEFDGGYAQGTIISNNEIELIYLIDGENASVAIDKLQRIKA